MFSKKEQQYLETIQNAYAVWFSTVRDDGMPQPTPVWFIWQEDYFLVYTTPEAQKLRNVEQNNKVAISYATDVEANGYVVVMGEATVDYSIPLANQNPGYMEKYKQGFVDISMTPDSFTERFTVPIRITPQHVRGE